MTLNCTENQSSETLKILESIFYRAILNRAILPRIKGQNKEFLGMRYTYSRQNIDDGFSKNRSSRPGERCLTVHLAMLVFYPPHQMCLMSARHSVTQFPQL